MKKRVLFVFTMFIFISALLSSAVQLSPLQPISTSGIGIEKLLDGYSGNIKTLSVSFDEPSIGRTGRYDSFIVKGCSFNNKYGYQMPVKNISFELPKGASLSSVKIKSGQWQEIEGKYSLPPSNASSSVAIESAFLPGAFIEAGYAQTAKTTIANISIYPVQYNPKTKNAIFLKNAEIEVSYGVETVVSSPQVVSSLSSSPGFSTMAFVDDQAECLIITPEKYLNAAMALKAIHENNSNPLGDVVLTRVITTEEIAGLPYGDKNQPSLQDLPTALCPEGDFTTQTDKDLYPNRTNKLLPRYNDILAQKILSFLLDCHNAPGYEGPDYLGNPGWFRMHSLKYIVILGNANEVPPSDYVYSTVTSGAIDDYDCWVPTDYFYSACSRFGLNNLNPHCGIGRIPVNRVAAEDIVLNSPIIEVVIGDVEKGIKSTIKISGVTNPFDIEAGMTVVMRSGKAEGRWLDIEEVVVDGSDVTLTLQDNRSAYKSWLDEPAVEVNDRVDIVDTIDRMNKSITKLETWVSNRTGDTGDDWFRSASFAGGTYKECSVKTREDMQRDFKYASTSSLFVDELSCLEVINAVDDIGGDGHSYMTGLGVRKYFASDIKNDGTTYDEAFMKSDIEKILQNDSDHLAGILYFAGVSGYTDFLVMEDAFITSDELLNYPASVKNSFIISHANSTGAFDEDLWDEEAIFINISIGNALLLSDAGAFAYFGPARNAYRLLEFVRAEDGLLEFSQTHTNELTKNILQFYHKAKYGDTKLGDIILDAFGSYYSANEVTDPYHFRTLVEFNLLGSPCIYIPVPGDFEDYTELPTAKPLDSSRVNSENIPVYEVEDGDSIDVSFSYEAQDEVELKLVDARYYVTDDKQTGGEEGEYTPAIQFDDVDTGENDTTNGPGLYFLRISQMENGFYSKEARYYIETVNEFTPTGDILLVDDDQPRRYTASALSGYDDDWQAFYFDCDDFYKEALDELGKEYDVWHVENKEGGGNTAGQGRHGDVTKEVLNAYKGEGKAVIWYTGNDWFTIMSPNETEALEEFLTEGGRLFLTGQDIGVNIGDTAFYQNVLRATKIQDDVWLTRIEGIAIDQLSSGLSSIIITGGTGAHNQRWPSEIDPQSGASSCLLYNTSGGAGIRKSSGSAGIKYYNTQTGQAHTYFAFGFEAINNLDGPGNGRKAVMENVLNWLENPSSTDLFTALPGDGEVTLQWTNESAAIYPGVLILYREAEGYPTTDPTNGISYVNGQILGDGTVIYVQSPAGGSFSHSGLTNDITYYYIAYVFDNSNNYVRLGEAYAMPQESVGPGVIPSPTNLVLTADYNEGEDKWSIHLSWIDNSSDEDGFKIARKKGDEAWNEDYATVGANISSYTDDESGAGLAPNTVFYYKVCAYKGSDKSSYTQEKSTATSPIKKPTNLKAEGRERKVWLTWTNNSPGADGFEIWRSHPTPDAWTHIGNFATTSVNVIYWDEALDALDGRPYFYKIRPYKTGVTPGGDWWSDVVSTNPIPSAFPGGEDPVNLEALEGWNTVVIRFDDRTDNEKAYYVELWNKVPNNTELPNNVYQYSALTGDNPQEIVLTLSVRGKYYARVIAEHNDGGLSRYATTKADSSKTYVSFEIVEGLPDENGGSTGSCFIATAAYGTPMAEEVVRLRSFRDSRLLTHRAGRAFVRWYYRHSPPVAEYIRDRRWARAMVRTGLRPLLWVISYIK